MLATIYVVLNGNVNALLLLFISYFLLTYLISKITRMRIGTTLIISLISYAIGNIALLVGGVICFMFYKTICGQNALISVLITSMLQFLLVYLFFKIKRFKNGLSFIYKKIDKDIVDSIAIYVSVGVILIACFMGAVIYDTEDVMLNIFITFVVLGITMYIMIRRTLTMQYKHSLLLKTLEEYKEEIATKDREIEKLSNEKFNTSKIRHEFYNRQKALELMVKQNISGDINKDVVNESVLNIINELTSEYSRECEIIKDLVKLPKVDIVEIDNMFKYMQTECAKNNIDFKLNIQDSIHPLVNNYISKSRLETLLGDHVRDAINAVNKSASSNKEILVVLGLKDGFYEICVYDNGVEFSTDVLLKLGKEQITTGGTGIGFLTTFETLTATKASLVITEFNTGTYTKSVAISFNNKNEYVINSYRADSIREKNNREDIIINEKKS